MLADQFLNELEKRGMLEADIIAELRQQVAGMDTKVAPEAIAKLLVTKGHLTRFQATKLVTEITAPLEERREERAKQRQAKTTSGNQEGEELSLLELPPETPEASTTASGKVPAPLPPVPAPPVNPATGGAPVAPANGLTPIGQQPPSPSLVEESISPASPAGLTPISDGGLTPLPATGNLASGETTFNDPLSDVFEGDYNDPLLGAPAGAEPNRPANEKVGKHVVKRMRANEWDSKLLFLGGAGLMVLLFAAAVLYFSLNYGSAKEMFDVAEGDYRNESYPAAIKKLETYLKKFPEDTNASRARVMHGLARLRIALQSSAQPRKGLDAAKSILPEIKTEEAFAEVRPELTTMLPEIAETFSERADKERETEKKIELVSLTEQALELLDNSEYIPSSSRPQIETELKRIHESLNLAKRDINRESRLQEAVLEVGLLVEKGQTDEANLSLKELLFEYPSLEKNERISEVRLTISKRNRQLVKVITEAVEVRTEAVESPPGYHRVMLSTSAGEKIADVDGQVECIVVAGVVYGLESETGQVLWQRFVGFETDFDPQPVSAQTGADFIVVDGRKREVLRVASATGALRWAVSFGEAFVAPVVFEGHVAVVTRSGRLQMLDLETGTADRQVQLPQGVNVGPAMDLSRGQIYQVAEHSNIYVLSLASLECEDVVYLGHKAGTVRTPPVFAVGQLFVAENVGLDHCELHVFTVDRQERDFQVSQNPLRLDGNIVTSPRRFGRNSILYLTDRRGIHAYQIDANSDTPVSVLAQQAASGDESRMGFPLIDGSQLWVADDRLEMFQIQITTAKLSRKWIEDRGQTFTQPLHRIGKAVMHVSRSRGGLGYRVATIDGDDPKQSFWHAQLGDPIVHLSVTARDKPISVITASGGVFQVSASDVENGMVNPIAGSGVDASGLACEYAVELAEGVTVLVDPQRANQILVYDPSRSTGIVRANQVLGVEGEVAGPPIEFQDAVLLPLENGEVHLVDFSGQPRALPFHPPLGADTRLTWSQPVSVKEGQEFVIADSRNRIYRVGIKSGAQPALNLLREERFDLQIGKHLAALEDGIYAVFTSDVADTVVIIDGNDLSLREELSLEGRVNFGPLRVRDLVLVASDLDGLMAFDTSGSRLWQTPLEDVVAGIPLLVNELLVVPLVTGQVLQISMETGEIVSRADVRHPLSGRPHALESGLLFPGSDGALHRMDMPELK